MRGVRSPVPLGLAPSFGFGDRLGLATPGHLAALTAAGTGIAPILAQQSVRELERTQRTWEDVLDAAEQGIAAAGWDGDFGADGDHLKKVEHVRAAAMAGYSFFTLDPSDHVFPDVAALDEAEVAACFARLPWRLLDDSPRELLGRHRDAAPEDVLRRAAVKYLRAVAHAAELSREVPAGADLELSVDETESPTSPVEHAFIAQELARRGIRLTSLAPRFPGRFEKGIDYRGSLESFEEAVHAHAALAAAHGPYKLSLHSGSDKLSIYRIFARVTGGRFHVKTAGTSYLEALRVVAVADPILLGEIWSLARERYHVDRRSYHLTAELSDVPAAVPRKQLPDLLVHESSRRILHVTFGSVLSEPRLLARLRSCLLADGGSAYKEQLLRHFRSHLALLTPMH